MPRTVILIVLVITFTACVGVPGCIHWPDAPRLEAVSPTDAVKARLTKEAAGAKIITPIYRFMTDTRSGYVVSSQTFVYVDANNQAHRAEIDDKGNLTDQPVTLVDALPTEVHRRFFTDASGKATEGKLAGQVWLLGDAAQTYEFEYQSGDERGLGRISARGPVLSRQVIR